MHYPTYWAKNGDTYQYTTTGSYVLLAKLSVFDCVVKFDFFDGIQTHTRKREFPNANRAKNWAIKVGRLMHRLEQVGRVLTLEVFNEFNFYS
jgi:hypothetical protein